ncbi:MAG TPA: amidase [Longimicrobiales bacterium]|nr:amidase [Longimicrobiales bacterium]
MVEAHIRRIQAVNPVLNAVVAERFDAARREAQDAERRLRDDPETPGALLGVPFTVKEMVDVEGMPDTFGSRGRAGRTAGQDATAVRRLRAAGAIPLGVTNVPEWGFWFETTNLVYGRTSNPYDPSRTPGGSSGGEAAIIAAGGSPFGLGSDIGGSVRIPAAFCGIYGHKPTHGLVPLTGHYPVYESGPDTHAPRDNPYVVLGPLARSARDLMPLLRLVAGPDGVDPNAEEIPLGDPRRVAWKGRRVLVLDDPRITLAARATSEVKQAVWSAARALEALGAGVELLPDAFFRAGAEVWFAALLQLEGPPLRQIVGIGGRLALGAEFARSAAGRARYSFPTLMFLLGEALGGMPALRSRSLLAEGRRLADRLADRLGGDGVLLMPPHPRTAPTHNAPLLRPFDFAFTGVLNVLRIPVTVAPVGRDAHGLPLAVQVASRRGNDHVTIAAAQALETALGGWRPPAAP